MNRRGAVFFGLYLFLLAIIMTGYVVVAHLSGSSKINAAVVSPVEVLELRDQLEIFELIERENIKEAVRAANNQETFGSEVWAQVYRQRLVFFMQESKYARNFVQSDLLIEGSFVDELSDAAIDTLFANRLYLEEAIIFDEEVFCMKRSTLTKSRRLLPDKEDGDLSFPVDLSFTFEKEYLINSKGDVVSEDCGDLDSLQI